jgi:hypothetical protein
MPVSQHIHAPCMKHIQDMLLSSQQHPAVQSIRCLPPSHPCSVSTQFQLHHQR